MTSELKNPFRPGAGHMPSAFSLSISLFFSAIISIISVFGFLGANGGMILRDYGKG